MYLIIINVCIDCSQVNHRPCIMILSFLNWCFCCFLIISGEDGRSRAEQLLHILRKVDQYVSSSLDYQRKRGCLAAHELLLKFRMICISGYCALGCRGTCTHREKTDRALHHTLSNLPCKCLFFCIDFMFFCTYLILFPWYQLHLLYQTVKLCAWEIVQWCIFRDV